MVLCSVIAQKLHRIQIFRIVSTVLLTFFFEDAALPHPCRR